MRTTYEPRRIGPLRFILLAAAAVFWLGAGSALAGQNVKIKDPAMVADLSALSADMNAIAHAVVGCMQGGKSNTACICENREKIAHFNGSVKRLFAKYPALKKDHFVHFNVSNSQTVNLNLGGIRKKADSKLSCGQ